jgi:hypothetical protein
VSSGQDDVVSNEGATAETGSVDEDGNLVLELSSSGQVSTNDLVVETGGLLVHRHGAADGPQVGPVGGLLV